MEGAQFAPLRKGKWLYGRDKTRMLRTVMYGIPNTDMIPWSQVFSDEVFFKNFGRVRDIETRPDGVLYLVLNNPHSVVRLTPKSN